MTPIRVLIVEDREDDADLVLLELEKSGMTVESRRVETAEELVEALRSKRWHVVITDHSLPRFSSAEALDCLQRSGQDIPCILVTGAIGEEAAAAAMKAGVRDFVLKGNLGRLASVVKRELEEAANRRARRQAERKLRESERRFQAMTESMQDALVSTDAAGNVVHWNRASELMFGLMPREMENLSLASLLPGPTSEKLMEAMQLMAESGDIASSNERLEFVGRRKNGEEFPLEISLSRWRSEESLDFFTLIVRDLSDRARLEAQLRQAQKMEAFGQLAGGIAHDFNNLLTAIIGPADMALRHVAKDHPARKWIEMIGKAGDTAEKVVNQLLSFSKKQLVQPKTLDLNEVIRNELELLQRLIGESIELSLAPAPAPAPITADIGQIQQILLNFTVNARDAMPAGGKIAYRTEHVSIESSPRRAISPIPPGDYIVLSITDNGTGIPQELVHRIFEPFFTTKGPGKGTGLGLATCFSIIQQAKGTIEVDSQLGKGTTFRIWLPRAENAASSHPLERVPRKTKATDETILLVEDEPLVREMAVHALREHGYHVLAAAQPTEALELLGRHGKRIDLMVTDLIMPGMSGRELADRVKALYPGVKVLFVSGYTDDEVIRHGLSAGDLAFVRKPFLPDTLLSKVRAVLDENREEEAAA